MSQRDHGVEDCAPSKAFRIPVRHLGLPFAAVSATAAALTFGVVGAWAAEPVSPEQIMNALTPKPVTRSLTGGAPAAAPAPSPEQSKFINSLRNRPTRSLTTDERQELATVTKDKPSIDIDIEFAYNSADIGPSATPGVTALGKALSSPQFAGSTFVLAGHTDAKGGDTFNQDLSERRAEAVKRYLVQRYKLPAASLVSVGYGKTKLKNPDNPLAAENRRVQIVNTLDKNTAGK
jgi:outer membrane protein OmpA-like peptidoglycan-associated protein